MANRKSSLVSHTEAKLATLAAWIRDAATVVWFTGAGISTESGLPDYRGPDGAWTRRDRGLPLPRPSKPLPPVR
jgi:mono-ADP-ribosyltransferase sirtuin 6